MKRYGFTLAEVLITLGIISIVASMTMPILLNRIEDRILISKAKKTYSNFTNVINKMKFDIEASDYSDVFANGDNAEQIARNIAKYYKGSKVCNAPDKGCGTVYGVKLAKPVNNGYGGIAKENFSFPRIINTDGSTLYIRNITGSCGYTFNTDKKDENGFVTGEKVQVYDSRCATIVIDVNGQTKGPNQYRADVHQIIIFQNKFDANDNNFGALKTIFTTNKLDYEKYSDDKTFDRN